jgi:hypothetical protein
MLEKLCSGIIKRVGRGGTAICLGSQEPGFETPFETIGQQFASMGFRQCLTLDYDGRADIKHDLNTPLPDKYRGAADLLFDGGTAEHVANIGEALTTCVRLLKLGGALVQILPINGVGTGYYGVDPQLLHDFYAVNGMTEIELFICNSTSAARGIRRLAHRFLPARLVQLAFKPRLGPRLKKLVHPPRRFKRYKPYPDWLYNPAFADVPAIRHVPRFSEVVYVGRKTREPDQICWPSQRNYPKA